MRRPRLIHSLGEVILFGAHPSRAGRPRHTSSRRRRRICWQTPGYAAAPFSRGRWHPKREINRARPYPPSGAGRSRRRCGREPRAWRLSRRRRWTSTRTPRAASGASTSTPSTRSWAAAPRARSRSARTCPTRPRRSMYDPANDATWALMRTQRPHRRRVRRGRTL